MFPSSVVGISASSGKAAGFATGTAQEVSNYAAIAWTPNASTVPSTVTALGTLQATLMSTVKTLRVNAETSGVMFNGNMLPTDACSQAKYSAAAILALQSPSSPVIWFTSNNGYVTMTAQAVMQAGNAVTAYVQSCYAWEQGKIASINAATTTEELSDMNLSADVPQKTLSAATAAALTTAFPVTTTTLTVTCVAACNKFRGNSATPTLTRGAASGTTSTVTLTPGSTDSAGQISVATSGVMTTTSGSAIVTVNFSCAYTTAPFVTLTPSSATAAMMTRPPYIGSTTTGFTVYVAGAYIVTATTYTWTYAVVQ